MVFMRGSMSLPLCEISLGYYTYGLLYKVFKLDLVGLSNVCITLLRVGLDVLLVNMSILLCLSHTRDSYTAVFLAMI